mmetsp:Transcript_4941/g.6396  ORF Transcript_4941/g.6396 Transcript_4941/m.6396 type:complete len:240 (+) Transcript_4941:32-751(+)
MSFGRFQKLAQLVHPAALFQARNVIATTSSRMFSSASLKTVGISVLMFALPTSVLCAQQMTIEPATKLQFAETLEGLKLLGVGVRYKWGLVKVYAVGYYADAASSSPSLWQDLLESPKRKAIVIKMARNIDSQKLVDALEEAFKPRLALPGRSDANFPLLRKMILEVAGEQCNAGDEFIFECVGASSIVVKANKGGKAFQTNEPFVDRDISFALFDTYLGASLPEVSPTLKSSIKERLA